MKIFFKTELIIEFWTTNNNQSWYLDERKEITKYVWQRMKLMYKGLHALKPFSSTEHSDYCRLLAWNDILLPCSVVWIINA